MNPSMFLRVMLAGLSTAAVLSAAIAPALAGSRPEPAGGRDARGQARAVPAAAASRRVTGAGGALALAAARDNGFGSPAGRVERRVPVPSHDVAAHPRTTQQP